MLQQSAVVDYLKRKIRQRIKTNINTRCFVFNQAGFVINFQLVAVVDLPRPIRRLNQVEAAVDGVYTAKKC